MLDYGFTKWNLQNGNRQQDCNGIQKQTLYILQLQMNTETWAYLDTLWASTDAT